jgi:hypothetical protein
VRNAKRWSIGGRRRLHQKLLAKTVKQNQQAGKVKAFIPKTGLEHER